MAHAGGRPKGSPNHVTREIREMIECALHSAGGEDYLVEQARDNPTAFLGLVGKLLPKDMNLRTEVSVEVRDELITKAMALMMAKTQQINDAIIEGSVTNKLEVLPKPTEY